MIIVMLVVYDLFYDMIIMLSLDECEVMKDVVIKEYVSWLLEYLC